MRKTAVLSLSLALFVVVTSTVVVADVLPFGLKVEKVLDSAVTLGDISQAPTGELWLLEHKTGTVRVFASGIETANLVISVSTSGDNGLLDVAFEPDFAGNGTAFVSYVDTGGTLRVDKVVFSGGSLSLGANVLSLGSPVAGANPGGGLSVGNDGKLYVATGDLGVSADAQNDGSLSGKLLRSNLDGSVPVDNASGTLVWAKGFREGNDLALNSNSTRPEGTIYVSDLGSGVTASDEINAVAAGGNHGWDATSGTGGGYDDPLVDHNPTVGVEAVASLPGTGFGLSFENNIIYACSGADDVQRIELSGADLDVVDSTSTFFDPNGDRDGTPDATCPAVINTLHQGADGLLYGSNRGANPGVYRFYKDNPGPREVSGPGSPFELLVDKSGSDVTIRWESLGDLDAGLAPRNAGQHVTAYQVWEGSLPINGSYSHAAVADTDGVSNGPIQRTHTYPPSAGDRYFLINAQGDNLEGTLGAGRPGTSDYCDTVGWGTVTGDCAERWVSPVDGSEITLRDYNPASATYLQDLTMSDFRGRVVRMDISSDNCFWCNIQSGYFHDVEIAYRDRDLSIITVFTEDFNTLSVIAPANCASLISAWAVDHNELGPVLCDIDLDGNAQGDVSRQYWNQAGCGGTPQNFYIDQGHVIYDFVCGAELSSAAIETKIINEVNPEWCE